MNPAYDLLVIDLDGTLLGRDGGVSLRNRQAVAAARNAGMEVIIATGRALVESLAAIEAIDHDGLVVAAGGSLLCEASTGRTIDRHAMPHDLVLSIAQSLLDHGHKALILKDAHAAGYDYLAVGPGQLDPASQWWFDTLPVNVRFIDSLEDDPHPHDTVRAGAVACESQLKPLADLMCKELGDRCFLQHWSAVTESQSVGATTHLLEAFNPNVSKWTMIASHCARQGIDPKRIAAIGDGLNDIELVRNAGLGIAMANCCEAVRCAAARITGDYESDGVAEAIERILAGEW